MKTKYNYKSKGKESWIAFFFFSLGKNIKEKRMKTVLMAFQGLMEV